jgi:hypothetical protein
MQERTIFLYIITTFFAAPTGGVLYYSCRRLSGSDDRFSLPCGKSRRKPYPIGQPSRGAVMGWSLCSHFDDRIGGNVSPDFKFPPNIIDAFPPHVL